jgi:osmotically-inducible protein OsmY
MDSDRALVQAVRTELEWAPGLDASRIEVLVAEGIVTLRGKVASFAEKLTASRAAFGASGVLYVWNQLEVALRLRDRIGDDALRLAAERALQREPNAPNELVTADVSNGEVTLRGVVDQPLQIDASAAAVRRLAGVMGLRNELTLRRRTF